MLTCMLKKGAQLSVSETEETQENYNRDTWNYCKYFAQGHLKSRHQESKEKVEHSSTSLSIFFSHVNVCCTKVKQILCSVTFLYRAEIQLSMLVEMCWNRYRLCYVILFVLSAVYISTILSTAKPTPAKINKLINKKKKCRKCVLLSEKTGQ